MAKKHAKYGYMLVLIAVISITYGILRQNNSTKQISNKDINTSSENDSNSEIKTTDKSLDQDLIYFTLDGKKGLINTTDGVKKKLLFTDEDTKPKIRLVGNYSLVKNAIIALMTENESDKIADLYLISADGKGKLQKLANDFSSTVTSAPQISPDGSKIAYTSFSKDELNYGYSLYTMNINGTNVRQVAHEQNKVSHPVWSLDSKSISYVTSNGNNSLNVINLSDYSTKTLLTSQKPFSQSTWDTQNNIYFNLENEKDNNSNSIYKVSTSSKKKQFVFTNDTKSTYLILSPNGQLLGYAGQNKSGQNNIYVYSLEHRSILQVAQGNSIIGWMP